MKFGDRAINNYDVLKAIAALCMLIDHLGYFFWNDCIWLRVLGRCSFPIYAILHGISYRRFHVELIYYCINFEIITFVLLAQTSLSVISSFCLSSLLLPYAYMVWQKYPWVWMGLAPLLIYCSNWLDLHIEYGAFALLFMLIGKILQEEDNTHFKHCLRRLVITIITVGFILNQAHGFGFSQLQILIISIELVAIISSIYWLPLWQSPSIMMPYGQTLILLLSRYSLQFYCIHYILFTLIWYWQYLTWSAISQG